jgi:phosphoenolpyruvate synthase/pyruvate phosphate dikinase
MKKIFKLQENNKKPERTLEATKHEIRKYVKRERKKKLPDKETMFWDFDCRFGQNSDEAQSLAFDEIIKALDKAYEAKWPECYIEIMARAADKPVRTVADEAETADLNKEKV